MPKKTIEQRFLDFHQKNPHIYDGIVRLARTMLVEGRKQAGIELLFAGLRWNRFVQTQTDDYKLNNNYTSRYARLIMEREPDLSGFFKIRELRTP